MQRDRKQSAEKLPISQFDRLDGVHNRAVEVDLYFGRRIFCARGIAEKSKPGTAVRIGDDLKSTGSHL